jgi:pimeloyl-ACP methyl ester carboxylesterase
LLALLALTTDTLASRIELRPCAIKGIEAPAQCGRLAVLENRAAADGRRIALKVVVLPATEAKRQPDPVFILAGGPGQAASDNADFFARIMGRVRRERDIVLVDQRGTGESNPLNCDLYGQDVQSHLGDLFPPTAVERCFAEWQQRADLRFYTTDVAMTDLDEVREALGYQQINLFGTSYGTRAAQVYMRQFPKRLRTVIMKGVTSITTPLTMPMAQDAQRSLDLLFQDCAADSDCRAAFPKLKEEAKTVFERLENEVEVEVAVIGNGTKERAKISRAAIGPTLRSMLQSNDTAAKLPLLLHQAAQGDFGPLASAALTIRRGFSKLVSVGLFLTVVSPEDVAISNPEEVARASAGTFLRDDYYKQLERVAPVFPKLDMPADYRAPVKSPIPTLLISGFVDPATPPSGGDEVGKHLPNSLHVVARYGSHSYGGMSPCIDDIMAEFIERGTMMGVDTSCAGKIKRPPFATTDRN